MLWQRRPGSRKARRASVLLASLALCSGALAACGSGNADGLTEVTVGVGGTIFDTPLRVAEAKGYFRAAGLDVSFVDLAPSLGSAALQSDSVQFLNDSPTAFLSAISHKIPQLAVSMDGAGAPLGLAVSTRFAQAHHLTADTPPAEVAKALQGSVGGASSATTKGQAGIFLRAYGISPDTIKYASLPSPAADKAALNNNLVDWFITSEPTPLDVQDEGGGVVVAGPDTVPVWSVPRTGYGQVVVVRKDWAPGNADVIRRFVAAVEQGSAYARGHEADVVDMVGQTFAGMPDPVLLASIRQVDWPATGAMSGEGWKTSLGFIAQTGAVPKNTTVPADSWTNQYLSH